MQTQEVREYYDILTSRRAALAAKRSFDVLASGMLLLLLSPAVAGLSAAVKLDSEGPVFFRQERITQYGQSFRIHKFRSMVSNAEKLGTSVTVSNDARITKVGAFLRRYHLDEIPQLLDILSGDMSFVGTRPEVPKYVRRYSPEMMATLLLPAGVTSSASIRYKDEMEEIPADVDADEYYIQTILPDKMRWNLEDIRSFGCARDIKLMIMTVWEVLTGK